MSITSKIALSALLLGASLPAFAQGPVSHALPHATTSSHAVRAQKISSPIEAAKAVPAKPATVSGTVAKPDATVSKTDLSKTDMGKPAVNAGIAKPGTAIATPAPLPAVKTN